MIDRNELTRFLDATYEPWACADSCPNGLQVEGQPSVRRIAFGVSASLEFLTAAAKWGADAVVVHHGLFWDKEPRALTGFRRRRLQLVLEKDLNVYAWHLPMDAHATLGNNTGLLRLLGATPTSQFGGRPPVGWVGELAPTPIAALLNRLRELVHPDPWLALNGPDQVTRIAAITGGGPWYFEEAIATGADLFVTGETNEPAQAMARELGVHFIAAGHHNTERIGPMLLQAEVERSLGVECTFIDVPNLA